MFPALELFRNAPKSKSPSCHRCKVVDSKETHTCRIALDDQKGINTINNTRNVDPSKQPKKKVVNCMPKNKAPPLSWQQVPRSLDTRV